MEKLGKLFAKFRSKKFRQIFLAVFLLVILIAGGVFYLKREGRVFIDDSLVEAPIISLTSPAPGVLNESDVTEGQAVHIGDQLAVVGTQVLRAQTDGIIIEANKELGSLVAPGTPAVQMINPDDFRVVATLDENKGLKDIKVGQVASFTVDAYPGQTFWGYVDEVSPTAKQTQLSFSISSERPTQQFDVYIRFDSFKHPQIKNGMSAKAVVYTNTN